jgi:XTP/dITP diphosphohydrolase
VTARLVLLVTSPRVAAGLLSSDAWAAVHAGPVFVADRDAAVVTPLESAGVDVRSASLAGPVEAMAREVIDTARQAGTATWWVGTDDQEQAARALADLVGQQLGDDRLDVDIVPGSWDLPGARLLDVVTTMDRLRSPGGCPWDAQQDHLTLAPYLLEEAYEAFQSIEDRDSAGLREELGDVLLQVAFHARLAEELPGDERWSIDDVATGLVEKLVRRHPHVFGGVVVSGVDEVNTNWETIKAAERSGASVVANVALAAPALTLAETLQRKALSADALQAVGSSLAECAAQFERTPSVESAGALLWAAVAAMRLSDIDAEGALRSRARRFRDQHISSDRDTSGR